jgi:hypothetical protein
MIQEMSREYWNLLASLSEWRNMNPNNVQAMEKVLSEPSIFNCPLQIRIGCGDDSYINSQWFCFPSGLNFSFLEETH